MNCSQLQKHNAKRISQTLNEHSILPSILLTNTINTGKHIPAHSCRAKPSLAAYQTVGGPVACLIRKTDHIKWKEHALSTEPRLGRPSQN